MSDSPKQFSWFVFVYFLLPIPVAWLSLSLMSMYLRYYDIGINSAANNVFLIFFVAPALLIGLYITAITCLYLANRLVKPKWLGVLLCYLLVFLVGIGSFALEVRSVSDYPTDEPQQIGVFLKYYSKEIVARITHSSGTPNGVNYFIR